MRLLVAVILVGLLSLNCGGGGTTVEAPSEVTLAYQDQGGEYIKYKVNTNITTNVGGQVRQWMSENKFSVRIDAIGADGVVERRLKIDDFVMGEISGGGLVPNPNASKYIGESLYLKTGPKGEVLEWQGLDGVMGYTIESKGLRDFLVQQVAQMFMPLGAEPLSVGSTWQSVLEIPIRVGGGDYNNKITTDYRLDGFGKKSGRTCAKIKMDLQIEGEGSGSRGPKRFWYTGQGDGGGEIWFDYVNGVVVEYNTKVTVTQEHRYERAGKEDVTAQTTTIDRELKVKLIL